ncbi:MAG TPA: transketolase C-terminal domain-containing protein [Candidatus Limnocylindrales bacterium]|nr:transketolase C-terminal domain-containing protein [Candidatus Limnocylindrales bacterium]
MTDPTMRAQFATTTSALLHEDPRVALVLADISTAYFEEASSAHPERVVNVGIMEQTAVSLAAGFALEGFIPFVHSIAPFLVERPYEQIKDDFCYQGLGGVFASTGASYDYASDGMTHHGSGDVPILKILPRMEVLVPGTATELDALLRQTYADGAPTYIRISERTNAESRAVRFGRLEVVRDGRGPTIVAVGPLLDAALEAAGDADASIVYCTTVVPFDGDTLRGVVAGGDGSVLLVEPYYAGGLVPDIVAALAPRSVRIETMGVPRAVLSRYGTREDHDRALGLTAQGIRARLAGLVAARA